MTLQALIDKQDNFEIVGDQLAALLVAEVSNQKSLAANAGKLASDWALRIYRERTNAWELWLNDQGDPTPIVNVSFDTSSVDGLASDPMYKQKTNGIYNIDCYGLGVSTDEPLSGHTPGDEQATREAQRAARLVRNILMAGENTYLQMRGVVGTRKVMMMQAFQPLRNENAIQQTGAIRVQVEVGFNEFVDQYVGQNLEYVAIDVLALSDGQIILEADYQYPLP